ncbi:hypothetical protein [Streptomyces sp. CA-111067]|uniref:hypothetical protein n=1 Tax=Streptomyces sp. CA-111067 TaxID=3240046 RepID=UPI003D95A52E
MSRPAPRWAWGFVAGGVAAFLGLVTHWYSTVPPGSAGWDSTGHSYGAFSVEWLGAAGPVFMLLEAGRWFGALREWWRVPALADWRRGRTAPADPEPGEGAGPGALIGLASLALLGICRAAVPTHHVLITFGGTGSGRRNISYAVHVDFGFWCMLAACALFVVSGSIGWFTRERIFLPGGPAAPGQTALGPLGPGPAGDGRA